jgi:hypothetical protein
MPLTRPIEASCVGTDSASAGARRPSRGRGYRGAASAQLWTCGRWVGHFCPDLLLGEAEADEPEHAKEGLGVDGVCHAGREHGGDVVEVDREKL